MEIYLLPLSLTHLPQQKTPFKLAILHNKSIADAHPSFFLEEAILFIVELCFQLDYDKDTQVIEITSNLAVAYVMSDVCCE